MLVKNSFNGKNDFLLKSLFGHICTQKKISDILCNYSNLDFSLKGVKIRFLF